MAHPDRRRTNPQRRHVRVLRKEDRRLAQDEAGQVPPGAAAPPQQERPGQAHGIAHEEGQDHAGVVLGGAEEDHRDPGAAHHHEEEDGRDPLHGRQPRRQAEEGAAQRQVPQRRGADGPAEGARQHALVAQVQRVRQVAGHHHLHAARRDEREGVAVDHGGAEDLERGAPEGLAREQRERRQREHRQEPGARGDHGAVEVCAEPSAVALLRDEPLQPEADARHQAPSPRPAPMKRE